MNETEPRGMKECVLIGYGLSADRLFHLDSPGNRDGCYEPYVHLAQLLRRFGYAIHTPDRLTMEPAFELHMDVHEPQEGALCYLLLLEASIIRPGNSVVPPDYRKVFTWNDRLVDRRRFIKINLPNSLVAPKVDDFSNRDHFCCMIAGNKVATVNDVRELYTERVRAVRWFEEYAAADFDLYGVDWDLPPSRPGLAGKVTKRLWRYITRVVGMKPFPSYRGKVERKRDVLQRTRFSICYENVRDMPGYITEKIFDCFFAGCVPVYWGADNVTDYIPAGCFIDRRKFADTAAVYAFLKEMDEATYCGYQHRIAVFLASDAAKPFSSETFAETIASTIVQDLGRAP